MATFTINLLDSKEYLFSGDFTNSGMTTFTGIASGINGLSMVGSRQLKLGGTLCQDTIITSNTYNFTLSTKALSLSAVNGITIFDTSGIGIDINSNGNSVDIRGNTSGGVEKTKLLVSSTQTTFTDSRTIPTGIQYNADYSTTYTNRSLVDKAYVDNKATGLNPLQAVEVATTTNINLSSAPATIGGVILTNGMRVLVKNQISGATNGIYIFNGAGFAMTRSSDFSGNTQVVQNSYVSVISGTTNQNTSWILNTPNPIIVGVTSLTFVLFSSPTGVVSGNGICVTQCGGNYNVAIKSPANCGLCSDASGLYISPAIGGVGICYGSGTLCINGSDIAGNSLSWTGTQLAVNISGGTLSTVLASKLNVTNFNSYSSNTLTNINNRLLTTIFNTYTGTTAPNQFASKTIFNTYTGTTAPNTYYNKIQINSYSGKTATAIGLKAPIDSPTFTTFAKSVTPAQNDNTTCIATTAWYINQGGTANPLMDGIAACGTSNLFSRQDHVHPSDTSKLSLSGGTMIGALKGTIFSGSTCIIAPITIGTTCVCSPVVLGSTCVCGAIVCGACGYFSTRVCSPVITGSTKICSPIICGTSCVSGAIISGSTCMITPVIRIKTGAGIGKVLTSTADGTGCWCSQAASVSFCWAGTTANGVGTYVNANCICSQPNMTFNGSTLSVTGSMTVSSNAKIINAITGGTLYLTTTPPVATVQEPTVFWNSISKQIEAKQLTGGTDFYKYCECAVLCCTTNTTCVKYLGFTGTTLSGRYQVDWNSFFGNITGGACTCIAYKLDNTIQGEVLLVGDTEAGWSHTGALSRDVTLKAANHCFDIYYWNTAGTACINYASVRAKRIC